MEDEDVWDACHDESPDFSDDDNAQSRFRSDIQVQPRTAGMHAHSTARAVVYI